MEEDKNLVKKFLLEKNIISSDTFLYSYFYECVEWFVYKISDNTIRYISYELTEHGLGYAFCSTVVCNRFSYDIKPVFYTKSFTSDYEGEWVDISDELKDKFISDTMRNLQVWKNK